MKTRTVKGLTILGIGAMICGVAAAQPASADECVRPGIDIRLVKGVHLDLVLPAVRVVEPCRRVVVVEHRDRDWRRDRDRDHDRR